MVNEPRSVGGFFELELPTLKGALPPVDAALFRSGRACLRSILETERPRRLLVPFYVCDAALEAPRALDIPIVFYPIDRGFCPILPDVLDTDVVLAVNHFGLHGTATAELSALGSRLILDQTHAFFAPREPAVWQFTSARKWFGVPDGGLAWGPRKLPFQPPRNLDRVPIHLIERRFGGPAAAEHAYRAYQEAEASFDAEAAPISLTTVALLSGVDVDFVQRARRQNYERLHARLAANNTLALSALGSAVPFCYPFLPRGSASREALAKEGVFVPRFWQDCLDRGRSEFAWELELSARLLPLPVDHRYGESDMDRVADRVQEVAGET
jgi:hypothetical protein